MIARKKSIGAAAFIATGVLLLSACGSTPEVAPTAVGPSGEAAAVGPCEVVMVGDFTRCDNFYEDYWPEMNRQLDALYEQAKETDGGRIVIWDWYELSPDVIAVFNKRFPDITIETRGLTYNLSSAIITAQATGTRNSDIVSGSIVSAAAMHDEGFWEKVDWTQFGVPEEFLTIGSPEMMPDSVNGSLMQYNADKIEAPATLPDLLDPSFKGKVSVAAYNPVVFAGYGMAEGEEAMVKLITDLKSSGNLQILEDQNSPLSSGDVPISLNQTLFNPNPSLKVSPYANAAAFAQFSGVNVDADNKPGAMLWVLWNAFDPDWLEMRMTQEDYSTTQVPYVGLPASLFSKATGLMKTNADALLSSIDEGAMIETVDTRDKWIALTNAADDALNG